MPRVHFTPHLRRHLECPPPQEIAASTVGEALQIVFQSEPRLRSYVLDDQGQVRQHVMIFVDDRPISDRQRLSDPLQEGSAVYVMQALSGG
jgi:hypothetical protein